jgi:hypothetical protein
MWLTLHLQVTHFTSPCEWILGCHSCPFSKTSPVGWYLQPPLARISLSERCDSVPLAFCWSIASCPSSNVTGGHCLQHAFLSGRKASRSVQFKGGHCIRGQCTSRVLACHEEVKLNIKGDVVWDIILYSMVQSYQHFRIKYCLDLQPWRGRQQVNPNTDNSQPDYTSNPRQQQPSLFTAVWTSHLTQT